MTEEDLIGKNLIELQRMIVPPAEPPPISLWPETEAWIWLGIGLYLLATYAVIKWHDYRKANAYRRAAVVALKTVGEDAAAIAAILRRAALAAYPRSAVAALHGEDWLRLLDKTRGKKGFETDLGRKMLRAPYRASQESVEGLNRLATDWVRHHSAEVQN
jgi:hypothetical protein